MQHCYVSEIVFCFARLRARGVLAMVVGTRPHQAVQRTERTCWRYQAAAEFPSGWTTTPCIVEGFGPSWTNVSACDRVCMKFNRPSFILNFMLGRSQRSESPWSTSTVSESPQNRYVQKIKRPYKSSSANSNSRRWNSQHHGNLHYETGVRLLQEVILSSETVQDVRSILHAFLRVPPHCCSGLPSAIMLT